MTTVEKVPPMTDVEPSDLRRAMGRFTTGVGLVMTETDAGPHGATINSLTWVSLEPPIILISLATASRAARYVREAGAYSVSILGARQARIASAFAKPGGGKFEGLEVHRGASGLPVAPRALCTLECSVEREIEVGDHVILLGRVHSVQHRVGEPLAFYSGRFGNFVDPDGELDIWL
ncbi:flavin reductase family protein [Nocardia sp. CWNU-33]|uniref:flavin reductase family protein n=1 Tax=Nocardia sp. CWNU-33 TaxID=3392117 RepID=UPI00398E88AC